jgi:biotin carboxyl carrier protein
VPFEHTGSAASDEETEIMDGADAVTASVAGSVWQCRVKVGDTVEAGDEMVVLESMKTEIPVITAIGGEVVQVFCDAGDTVKQGQPICAIKPE